VFGPDTLQTYLEAENEAVEKYCSHEEPSSRSISAIARRFENLHSERSGSAASHVSAGPAGERKLLSSAAHRFRFLFWPSNFDRLFFPTADDTMRYKWGECKCGYSMCPWVYKSGRFQGQLRLVCRGFFKQSSGDGKPACWESVEFPMSRYREISQNLKFVYEDVKNALHRNSRK